MSRKDHHHKQDTIKRVALGSMLAATAGFVAGVLSAPKSGKDTRNDIKTAADKGLSQAERDIKKLHRELDSMIDGTKDNSTKITAKARRERDDLVEKAQDTKEKAHEMLSAVREGESDDRDLKKAIKDARASIDHLRDYLKK